MGVENLGAAKKLVEKYRSLTLDDITSAIRMVPEDDIADGYSVMGLLTGFGSFSNCSLCSVFENPYDDANCQKCIHSLGFTSFGNIPCTMHHTYSDISNAEDPEDIVLAIRARADYIESIIQKYENGN